jgi:hypothetical protein
MYLQVDDEDKHVSPKRRHRSANTHGAKTKKPLQQHDNIALRASNLINLVLTTAD